MHITFLVPAISEVNITTVEEGIEISWELLHSGGLDILFAKLSLTASPQNSPMVVVNQNISQPQSSTFVVAGNYLQAGQVYEAEVTMVNEVGPSFPVASMTLRSPVGTFKASQTPITEANFPCTCLHFNSLCVAGRVHATLYEALH